jgi:hypothetical protein
MVASGADGTALDDDHGAANRLVSSKKGDCAVSDLSSSSSAEGASAVIPAGAALADAHDDSKPHDSIQEWGVFASTTEALTVTLLTELLRRASLNPVPSDVSVILDGVYAAELDHWNFIHQHFRPSTKRFWIPDGFFGGAGDALDLTAVGQAVAAGEHLFVNTYLLGVTIFAAAGRPTFARYSAELAGDEAEHRVLGQFLAGESPPNNLGFELFEFSTVSAIEAALASAGVGLGQQGSAAGQFYDFPSPPMAPPIPISGKTPT